MKRNTSLRAQRAWKLIALGLVIASLSPITTFAIDNPLDEIASSQSRDVTSAPLLDLTKLDELAARQATSEGGPSPATTDFGSSIVGFALAYIGYPYIAAANGPGGFDCSGFTQYVVLNVLGVDIGHWLDGQPGMGAWIEYGAWQPGDLIFFQNTYRPGISHVAIYIGDGQIIHAENEESGVTIDSLYSSYYGSRYWGAVRVG